MKTFNDLKFEAHSVCLGDQHAKMEFDNGYGVSVVTGTSFYTSDGLPYEIAVTKDGSCCYDTPVTEDVIGHQTAEQVTEIMQQVQELPKA